MPLGVFVLLLATTTTKEAVLVLLRLQCLQHSLFDRHPMLVLDLFCGAGGAAMGYWRAGYEVLGVDKDEQPSYPFDFVQADALEALDSLDTDKFDLIHASPPCQGYSSHVVSDGKWTHHSTGTDTPMLIHSTRQALQAAGARYVIENVGGARDQLHDPHVLCGSMFGRPTPRHRLFETNFDIEWPRHPKCWGRAKAYAEAHGIDYRDMSVTGKSRRAGSIDTWRRIMTMPWAKRAFDLSEAIYPAYTEYIGGALYHVR